MSASTYASLIRNAGCVAKSLLPKEHILQKVVPLGSFLKNVKVVEYIIAPAQAAGVAYNVYNGYNDVVAGFNNYNQLTNQLATIDNTPVVDKSASLLLRQSVVVDQNNARTKLFVGLCKFTIGAGFVFLVLNTLHLNPPSHPLPLFRALIFIELSLISILCVMLKGIIGSFLKAKNLFKVSSIFETSLDRLNTQQRIGVASGAGFGLNSFDTLQVVDSSFTPGHRLKKFSPESVQQDVAALSTLLSGGDERVSVNDLGRDLFKKASLLLHETVLESAYFLLNAVAFYGYLIAVLDFFFPRSKLDLSTAFGAVISALMLKLSADTAMDVGFFTGDLAWTVEPALALASPFILNYLAQQVDRIQQNKKRV
jgi:hypothetical protein